MRMPGTSVSLKPQGMKSSGSIAGSEPEIELTPYSLLQLASKRTVSVALPTMLILALHNLKGVAVFNGLDTYFVSQDIRATVFLTKDTR